MAATLSPRMTPPPFGPERWKRLCTDWPEFAALGMYTLDMQDIERRSIASEPDSPEPRLENGCSMLENIHPDYR